jgi:hypothetical protein
MKRHLIILVVVPLVVLSTLVLPLAGIFPRGLQVVAHASRELNIYRVVFIGDDNLTLTVVSIIESKPGEFCPYYYSWLIERIKIEHYLDFKDASPGNLSDAYLVVFSGEWLTRAIGDSTKREEFLAFLRELHKARGGRGGYIAFGNYTSVLFNALCLAGIGDRIGCKEGINPFQNNPPVALVVFEDGVSIGSAELPPEERRPGASLEERLAEALSCEIYRAIYDATTRPTTTLTLTSVLPALTTLLLTILALVILIAVAIAVVVVIIVVIIVLRVVK